jgi:hypothetical protein
MSKKERKNDDNKSINKIGDEQFFVSRYTENKLTYLGDTVSFGLEI